MKQLIKISFLFIMLFLAIPAFADGDMGAGGNTCTTNCVKAPEPVITKSLDSANREEDAFSSVFSWIYNQIFESID